MNLFVLIVESVDSVIALLERLMKTKLGKKLRDALSIAPQHVRWTSGVHPKGAGILTWAVGEKDERVQEWIGWSDLETELSTNLLPSLFADPRGYSFKLHDFNGKKDWILVIIDDHGTPRASVWFGVDPDQGWAHDGLIRIGNASADPQVWQVYQRLSDGIYERLPSRYGDLDQVPIEMRRIAVDI